MADVRVSLRRPRSVCFRSVLTPIEHYLGRSVRLGSWVGAVNRIRSGCWRRWWRTCGRHCRRPRSVCFSASDATASSWYVTTWNVTSAARCCACGGRSTRSRRCGTKSACSSSTSDRMRSFPAHVARSVVCVSVSVSTTSPERCCGRGGRWRRCRTKSAYGSSALD